MSDPHGQLSCGARPADTLSTSAESAGKASQGTILHLPNTALGLVCGPSTPPARLLTPCTHRTNGSPPRKIVYNDQSEEHFLTDVEAGRRRAAEQRAERVRRAHERVCHVQKVVQTVRDERDREEGRIRREIEERRKEAGDRRQTFLEEVRKRGEERVNWARRVIEKGKGVGDCDAWERSVKSAEKRRKLYLEGRRQRALRFSPTRRKDQLMPKQMLEVESIIGNLEVKDTEVGEIRRRTYDKRNIGNRAHPLRKSALNGDQQGKQRRLSKKSSTKIEIVRRTLARSLILAKARLLLRQAGLLPGVPSDDSSTVSFNLNKATPSVEDPRAIKGAELLLSALNFGCGNARTRVLLVAFLITSDPLYVKRQSRSGMHHSTPDVLLYARCFVTGIATEQSVRYLARTFLLFQKAFVAWKRRDAEYLLVEFVNDAIALEELRKSSFAQRSQEWNESVKKQLDSIRESAEKLVGEEGAQIVDTALSTVREVEKERLLHDLTLDQAGTVEKLSREPSEDSIFWERLLADVSATPKREKSLRATITGIAQALNSLPRRNTDHAISAQSLERADLTRESAVQFLNMAVTSLQRSQPAADDTRLRIWARNSRACLEADLDFPRAVVKVLQELNKKVETLLRTVQRYQVEAVLPAICQQGPTWERSRFQRCIEAKIFHPDLPFLFELLYTALNNDATPHVDKGKVQMGSFPHIKQLFRNACVLMINPLMNEPEGMKPEILYLDHERLQAFKTSICDIAILCSLHREAVRNFGQNPDVATLLTAEGLQIVYDEIRRRKGGANLAQVFLQVVANALGRELSHQEQTHFSSFVASVTNLESKDRRNEMSRIIFSVVEAIRGAAGLQDDLSSTNSFHQIPHDSVFIANEVSAIRKRFLHFVTKTMEIHARHVVAAAKRAAGESKSNPLRCANAWDISSGPDTS